MHIFAFHTCSYNDRVEGAKPHTLHNQIFLKEITNEIRKKHKLTFHTREYHDGVGGRKLHTSHIQPFIKEITNRVSKNTTLPLIPVHSTSVGGWGLNCILRIPNHLKRKMNIKY